MIREYTVRGTKKYRIDFILDGKRKRIGRIPTKDRAVRLLAKYVAEQRTPATGAKKFRPEASLVVYFIQCTETKRIKIGYASNIGDRFSSIQIGSPTVLKLLATIPGGPDMEAELHFRFEACHLRGEWFNPSPELPNFIAGLEQAA